MLQENQSTSAIIDVPGVERRLDVISDTPISQRPYSTDVRSQEIIDETVDKLLAAGDYRKIFQWLEFTTILVEQRGA